MNQSLRKLIIDEFLLVFENIQTYTLRLAYTFVQETRRKKIFTTAIDFSRQKRS